MNIDDIISKTGLSESQGNILKPYEYLEAIPSNNNNIRNTLLHGFNELYFKIKNGEIISKVGEVISILHQSSLLIDDIEDSSDYRRGYETAHRKFGVPLTINCGNLMYFVAIDKALALPSMYRSYINETVNIEEVGYSVSLIISQEMINLHHGQGLDLYWREMLPSLNELPSIEEYLGMIMNKTGGLFRLSVRLLELLSPSFDGESVIPLANLLGILYQARDDYLNIVDSKYAHIKGFVGDDLIEGKLSLPILHCLLTAQEKSPVYTFLYDLKTSTERKEQPSLLSSAIKFMVENSKSMEFTRSLITEYSSKAIAMIEKDVRVMDPKESFLAKAIVNLSSV
ncbi:Piso0_005114 [Millerozyma farinosa CBS 7064]|uniref:Piso0_005114 protein n=1 Tax=Pichia sorbitophila (strain ATCC MYA-4447 / BCRC 22081 / CBS 7064 / NBRC 10061 / NRRL Y-12695) TaxID=559304 RepID=G8Y495_PICSO|nr:Piso0_005114 [Millerozyma farinosa CBS 7064]